MNIIITGASKGIGKETTLAFAEDKSNHVLAIARSGSLLSKLSKGSEHNNISYIEADLNESLKSPEKLLKEVKKAFNRVDILINNAGVLIHKPFDEFTTDEIRLMTETHFISPLLLTKTLIHSFSKNAHIVNISSMGGFQGSSRYPGMSVYSAVKGAIANLTESLGSEYEGKGLFFNSLALGAVQTEMLETAFPGYDAPLNAEEMAGFIYWFAKNGHRYFNGKVLPVSVNNP